MLAITPAEVGVGSIITPTFVNGWVVAVGVTDTGYFKRLQKIVALQGCVSTGTANTVIFTLPAGFRPGFQRQIPIVDNNVFGRVIIDPGGGVEASGGNVRFYLDGISFRTP